MESLNRNLRVVDRIAPSRFENLGRPVPKMDKIAVTRETERQPPAAGAFAVSVNQFPVLTVTGRNHRGYGRLRKLRF